ncbi:DUF2225 domain-containing protein [Clostridium sp.]|uniref:DUF2225 domain-containing protein n=1 Tax=Clostridium sp. TaxID=1506 RepID=UPI002FCB183F
MNDIFSGLEKLGFKEVNINDIYKTDETKKNTVEKEPPQTSLLYLSTLNCPVCKNVFKERTVKSSSIRIASKDSDFFIRYNVINPYFYDVWICNKCGYSALKVDFPTVREAEAKLILDKITPKFKAKEYPDVYDVNIAIERYKMALINAVYMESKASKKAIICLKLAWMYRLMNSENSKDMEKTFLKEAVKGLEEAYIKESFPIYGMDNSSTMYLIGEINRRISNYSAALTWFSNLITSREVKTNLKELARTQKDLIKEEMLLLKKVEVNSEILNSHGFDFEGHSEDESTPHEESTKKSRFSLKRFMKD